jgi:predicted HD superfamily hydrolase involved in NAD metabolism
LNHRYIPFLEQVLTPKRLAHSLGSMKVMGELAEVYGLDKEKAQTTGILHDAAKDLPAEIIAELMKAGDIRIEHECETDYVLYLHAPVSACFVRRELGITDELILEAIKTHCYYGASPYFDDPLAWCVRFADILEPTRNWEGEKILLNLFERLGGLVYAGKMKEGAFLQIGSLIRWYEEKGYRVHPTMRRIYQELGKELRLDDSFFE